MIDTIAGYVYRAEIVCPECIVDALPSELLAPAARDMRPEDVLDQVAAYVGIDRDDEHSFDSDDFPKVILALDVDDEDVCSPCVARIASH